MMTGGKRNSLDSVLIWVFVLRAPSSNDVPVLLLNQKTISFSLSPPTIHFQCEAPSTFVNGVFTPKTYQTFSVRTTGDSNAWVQPWWLGLITWLSRRRRFRKPPFSKCFPSKLKRKTNVFKFHQFEERFRKAPFSWRISVDGRRTAEIKLR